MGKMEKQKIDIKNEKQNWRQLTL